MYVSIPLIALALSLLTFAAAVISWFAARQARKDRVVTEKVPQLEAVVFGPPDQTGRPRREEGLEARVEALEAESKSHARRALTNARRIVRTQDFMVELVTNASSTGVEDTGRHRVLRAKLRELDDPLDSDPPAEDE
jgi:hypothetical protein